MALNHDLIRGLKGGKSFCLMEQTPSVTNWHPYNRLKRPGIMRLQSYQAVAHGADTVMFFQMRRSIGACEKYHGAVIDHAGHENTRVFREVQALGRELTALGDKTLGARTQARAAIVFDWENWWGIDYSAGPSILIDYHKEVLNYYEALFAANIPCDIIGTQADLLSYDLVIAPILYMVKGNYDEKLRLFVQNGGTLVTTYFSGYVDDSDLVYGAYPGKLRDILGIWVEESDALPEGESNSFFYAGREHTARILCDLIHPEGAKVLATYESDFYQGMALLTAHRFGKGTAYYVGTSSDESFYRSFLTNVCKECGIEPVFAPTAQVEVTKRESEQGTFLFFLNHGEDAACLFMEEDGIDLIHGMRYTKGQAISLEAKDVIIYQITN
jgi:beta-galactosidase